MSRFVTRKLPESDAALISGGSTLAEWGGLNEARNPHSLGRTELSVARNIWRRGKTIGTRPGFEREASGEDYDARISGSPAIQGMFEFRRNQDGFRDLIVVAGGDFYIDDSTSLDKTGRTISSGANYYWTFAVHKNKLYAAGGKDGDHVCVVDPGGTTLVAADTVDRVTFQSDSDGDGAADADIDAKYIFEWNNRLFLAGMNGTVADDNPMVVRYSALNDGDTWPIGNTIGGSSAIGGLSADGDEYITGINRTEDNNGDWLLVLTNKRLYAYTEVANPYAPFVKGRNGSIANGCVHHLAFVNLGLDSGDAVYASSSGIHSLRQSQRYGGLQKSFLSWKIRETWGTINQSRVSQIRGTYLRDLGLVAFSVPTGSNTTNDTILLLDIAQEEELTAENARWYIWRRSGADASEIAANALLAARDASDNWHIYLGNEKGDVLRTTEDTYSDTAASENAYDTHMLTKHDNHGEPGKRKGVGDVWIDVQPSGDYDIHYRTVYDYGSKQSSARAVNLQRTGAVWGTGVWGTDAWPETDVTVQRKLYGTGSGETIAHEIRHAVANEPWRIAQIAYQVRLFGESAETENA